MILRNFVFILFRVHTFRIKYGITILKRHVMHMHGVTLFVKKRNLRVGGVENIQFLAFI